MLIFVMHERSLTVPKNNQHYEFTSQMSDNEQIKLNHSFYFFIFVLNACNWIFGTFRCIFSVDIELCVIILGPFDLYKQTLHFFNKYKLLTTQTYNFHLIFHLQLRR